MMPSIIVKNNVRITSYNVCYTKLLRSNAISLSQSILKSMISQTNFAVATNDTKPILTGELFEIDKNILNVVAVDGYRLAVRTERNNFV